MALTAIILAGGLGTRLRDLVPNFSKPMAPIYGQPFLKYQIDYWIQQGIRSFILSVGYKKDQIMSFFGHKYKGAKIVYAVEDCPLGTGGALMYAAKELKEDFLLMNGDTFFEVNLSELLKFHLKNSSEWTFSLFYMEQSERYLGIEIDNNGRVLSLKSKPDRPSNRINGGVYLINPSALTKLSYNADTKASLEDDLLPEFILSNKSIFGLEFCGKFIDIGIPEDYKRAEQFLLS